MPLFDSPVFDALTFEGDGGSHSSGYGTVGIGCCCGGPGMGTPTFNVCDLVCTSPVYCTSVANTYCYSPSTIDASGTGCVVVDDSSIERVTLLGGCPVDIFSWAGSVHKCNPPAETPSWSSSMGPVCSGTLGGYTLTEPMLVLWLHGDDIYPWSAYYAIPLDGIDCTGALVLDLIATSGTYAGLFSFPASMTVTPCADP